MNYKQEAQDLFENIELNNSNKILELREMLLSLLRTINENSNSRDKSTQNKLQCPYCFSTNTKKYGKKANRAYCSDCRKAYVIIRNPLHYNKRYPDKILDLIVLIYTTKYSKKEIIEKLKISTPTYYTWKKEIIAVFPQLDEKFKDRSKTR